MAEASAADCTCRRWSSSMPPSTAMATNARITIKQTASRMTMVPRRENRLFNLHFMAFLSLGRACSLVGNDDFGGAGELKRSNEIKLREPLILHRHGHFATRPIVRPIGLVNHRRPTALHRQVARIQRDAFRLDTVVDDISLPVG